MKFLTTITAILALFISQTAFASWVMMPQGNSSDVASCPETFEMAYMSFDQEDEGLLVCVPDHLAQGSEESSEPSGEDTEFADAKGNGPLEGPHFDGYF